MHKHVRFSTHAGTHARTHTYHAPNSGHSLCRPLSPPPPLLSPGTGELEGKTLPSPTIEKFIEYGTKFGLIQSINDGRSPLTLPSVFGPSLRCQPRRGVNTREEWHVVKRMQELEASMLVIQWHPRVYIRVENRATSPHPCTSAVARVEAQHACMYGPVCMAQSVWPSHMPLGRSS
jgi:hypothetical protein